EECTISLDDAASSPPASHYSPDETLTEVEAPAAVTAAAAASENPPPSGRTELAVLESGKETEAVNGERLAAGSEYAQEIGGYESEDDTEEWDGGPRGEELGRPRRRISPVEIVQPPQSQVQRPSPPTPQQPPAGTDEAVEFRASFDDGGGGVDVGQYDGSSPDARQPSAASSGASEDVPLADVGDGGDGDGGTILQERQGLTSPSGQMSVMVTADGATEAAAP
ncbi:hypothetical protein Vafri_575, partial [Volvox africanus]